MADYDVGIVGATDIGATVSGGDTGLSTRRLYAFTDKVATLDAIRSPFFAYLTAVGKNPTNDPEFKMLEDRRRIDYTSRNFYLDGTHDVSGKSIGDTLTFTIDDNESSPGPIKWLVKGMSFAIGFTDSGNNDPQPIYVRVDGTITHGSSDTSFIGRIISDPTGQIAQYSSNDNVQCQSLGPAYGEGTGSPDVTSRELDSTYGYTQILKTAAEWTGTALATEYRGYRNEREASWAIKLVEHASDIERVALMSNLANQDGKRYSWGLVGNILTNQNLQTGTTAWTYSEGNSYHRQVAYTSAGYDLFLGDLEVLFDPARGGKMKRLVLSGAPVLTHFNKIGNNGFFDISTSSAQVHLNINIDQSTGAFDHKVTNLNTIHGDLHIIHDPILRGVYKDYMVAVDLANAEYRPLIGNNYSRDTHIILDVGADDEDLRKDMILTEFGMAFYLPEGNALWSYH